MAKARSKSKPARQAKGGKKERRPTTPSYVVELELATSAEDERRLEDRCRCGQRLSQVLLQDGFDIVEAMHSDPAWEAARQLPRSDPDARKEAFQALREKHDFTKKAFQTRLIAHKNAAGFSGRIGSHEAQRIADRIFDSLNKWVVGKGGRPRFKGQKRPLHSLEGKNQESCLKWRTDDKVLQVETGWTIGVNLPDMKKDEWLWTALQAPTKYCRIVWRQVRGRKRWYLQLIQEGLAPLKASLLAKLVADKDEIGGIDIGPSWVAWVTATEAGMFKFCAEVDRPHRAIRRLLRHIDRQRRANNPDNYDDKGRAKKGCRWKVSNNQRQAEIRLRELYRHEAAVRANAHGRDINFLLTKAIHWRDDGVSPKALQRMYGKSVSVRAPGHFMSELERKAGRAGGSRTKIEVRTLKTSQYDHPTDTFEKKTLSEREHLFRDGRGKVQRDIYSAFLARNSAGKTYQPCALETAWQALAPMLSEAGWYEPQVASEGLAGARGRNPSERLAHKIVPEKAAARKRGSARKRGARSRSGPTGAVRPTEAPA